MFAESAEIPFLQTSTSQVFRDMGLDPSVDYAFDVRMNIQERILAVYAAEYAKHSGLFITDRTPIDMMGYTLADVRQETLTSAMEDRLKAYCDACIKLTNKTFSILVVVQPGIPVVAEPGKASLSPGYIEHVAKIIMGITVGEEITASHFYIPRRMLKIEDRIACITYAARKVSERHKERLEVAEKAGSPIMFH